MIDSGRMMDGFDIKMAELLAHTKGWQTESRVAYIRPKIQTMYEAAHAAIKAKADAVHEARFGKKHPARRAAHSG